MGGKISKLLACSKLSSFAFILEWQFSWKKIYKSFSLRIFWLFLHDFLTSSLANQKSGARFIITAL